MTSNGSVTSVPQPAYGVLSGAFTGAGGGGANDSGVVLSYAFGANDANTSGGVERANGVVGFGLPVFTNSASYASTSALATQPYMLRLNTSGPIPGLDSNTGLSRTGVAIGDQAFAVNQAALLGIEGSALSPGNTVFNAAGQPVAFDSTATVVVGASCSVNRCFTQEIPTFVSISSAPLTTAAGFNVPAVSGAATVADFGRDADTGIRWGRYTNGAMLVVDRITGTILNGGNPVSTGNNRHFIYSDVQSGPTVLPAAGIASYSLVGGTRPTDQSNVGVLNSATLVANFSTSKVDVSVNATVAGNNWIATANAVDIQKGAYFATGSGAAAANNLNLTCSGSNCLGKNSGQIIGGFTGATGQGAAIAYTFNTSTYSGSNITAVGQTVSGVAAFKR